MWYIENLLPMPSRNSPPKEGVGQVLLCFFLALYLSQENIQQQVAILTPLSVLFVALWYFLLYGLIQTLAGTVEPVKVSPPETEVLFYNKLKCALILSSIFPI